MTRLLLIQRVAPKTVLRVWVGAFGTSSAPDLTWHADGQQVNPQAVRPLQSARADAILEEDATRVFCGVYELPLALGSTPPRVLQVSTPGSTEASLRPRSLPANLDEAADGALRVMVLSCFDWREDRTGRAGRLMARIPASRRPDLSVLMGDQVYLDLPTLTNFKKSEAWLAAKFERDYSRTWEADEGLREILLAAPSVCLPDDHEYWNNYPNPSPFVENTWTSNGRRSWRRAAGAL